MSAEVPEQQDGSTDLLPPPRRTFAFPRLASTPGNRACRETQTSGKQSVRTGTEGALSDYTSTMTRYFAVHANARAQSLLEAERIFPFSLAAKATPIVPDRKKQPKTTAARQQPSPGGASEYPPAPHVLI